MPRLQDLTPPRVARLPSTPGRISPFDHALHAERTIVHALRQLPGEAWTPRWLSMWFGIRIDRVHATLDLLEALGAIRQGDRGIRWLASPAREDPDGPLPAGPVALRGASTAD